MRFRFLSTLIRSKTRVFENALQGKGFLKQMCSVFIFIVFMVDQERSPERGGGGGGGGGGGVEAGRKTDNKKNVWKKN